MSTHLLTLQSMLLLESRASICTRIIQVTIMTCSSDTGLLPKSSRHSAAILKPTHHSTSPLDHTTSMELLVTLPTMERTSHTTLPLRTLATTQWILLRSLWHHLLALIHKSLNSMSCRKTALSLDTTTNQTPTKSECTSEALLQKQLRQETSSLSMSTSFKSSLDYANLDPSSASPLTMTVLESQLDQLSDESDC